MGKSSLFLTQNLPPSGVHRPRGSPAAPLSANVQESTWAAKGLSVTCPKPLTLVLLSPSAESLTTSWTLLLETRGGKWASGQLPSQSWPQNLLSTNSWSGCSWGAGSTNRLCRRQGAWLLSYLCPPLGLGLPACVLRGHLSSGDAPSEKVGKGRRGDGKAWPVWGRQGTDYGTQSRAASGEAAAGGA